MIPFFKQPAVGVLAAKNRDPQASTGSRLFRAGFSLVEVVVAMGIVSFALLAVLGAYGTIAGGTGSNMQRRFILESVDALRSTLNETGLPAQGSPQFTDDTNRFATIYGWVKNNGKKELVYITYKCDESGTPDSQGESVRSVWLDPDASGYIAAVREFEKTRESRWIKVRLSLAQANNPVTILPSDPADFKHAMLVLQVEMDTVPKPERPLPAKPSLTTHIAVLR